ncbi:uncharacterized protein AMSG_11762 [Thecamonas trahens ATCC 50062]|uniref:AAA+ ATPase domain-containing protein n=1 Tax=Thecamonas trahens ATCC 50062 TaxID=461836 RepID=A0A0L0D6J5_THETB|nr:hypothetical protein AMSG_11762 [Thecamonas trahens ATCC 50062]KNC46928.1 hypothetical protein AMSG_11762 [Thecamonas trahens ATCC 50062]|eukprot:XP_013760260.1 hypothetical protein AMSG_11762 [Thecamonas trahens ATCC 50062]
MNSGTMDGPQAEVNAAVARLAAMAESARGARTGVAALVSLAPSIFVLGPAGTGKTTLAGRLTAAWTEACPKAACGCSAEQRVVQVSGQDLVLEALVKRADAGVVEKAVASPECVGKAECRAGEPWLAGAFARVVIIDDAHELVVDTPYTNRLAGALLDAVADAATSRTLLVVIGASDVPRWALLVDRCAASVGQQVRMQAPTMAARKTQLAAWLSKTGSSNSSVDVECLASLTHAGTARDVVAGLLMSELAGAPPADALRYAMAHGGGQASGGPPPPPAATDGTEQVWVGYPEVRERLKSLVALKVSAPSLAAAYGLSGASGILLHGPPGVGKTLLGTSLAETLGGGQLRSMQVSLPDVLSPYVGETEANIRAVFEAARAAAPCLVFFDELDAFGAARRAEPGGTSDAIEERLLTQLLTELDGVSARGAVLVVGATSRPDLVDKALLRPGRFDALVHIPLPDATSRAAILSHFTHAATAANDDLVLATEGYSGADLRALVSACERTGRDALDLVASGDVCGISE